MKKLVMVSAVAVMMVGCGQKEAVSFNTLEEAKQQVRENALFNAQRFRQENPKFQDFSVVSNGDSTQMPNCPQGDGWATLTFISPDKKTETKVKCSSVSGATGCLTDAEFKTKPYAAEDGKCNANIPFPIPKIAR